MKIKTSTLLTAVLAMFLSASSFGQSQNNPVGFSSTGHGHNLGVVPGNGNRTVFVIPDTHLRLKTIDKSVLKANVELEKKKYLNYNYDLASVDNYDTKGYVRYNIFDDEIEFVKEKSIYYLAKEAGRKVVFTNTKEIYKVYDFNGELHFFKVHLEGENSLVAKQRVRYIDAKVAKSGYERSKPANYKRLKDELYLVLDNKLIKLSKKGKKDFYKSFGSEETVVKEYMKKNKLGYKNINDLKKVVQYLNELK